MRVDIGEKNEQTLYKRFYTAVKYIPCNTEYIKGYCKICENNMPFKEKVKRAITRVFRL